jgi:hypothetical protein
LPTLHPIVLVILVVAFVVTVPYPGSSDLSALLRSGRRGSNDGRGLLFTLVDTGDGVRIVDATDPRAAAGLAKHGLPFRVFTSRRGLWAMTEVECRIIAAGEELQTPEIARQLAAAIRQGRDREPAAVMATLAAGRWEYAAPLPFGYVRNAVSMVLLIAIVLGVIPTIGWIVDTVRENRFRSFLLRRCPRCGHDLRGIGEDSADSLVCPDCGDIASMSRVGRHAKTGWARPLRRIPDGPCARSSIDGE